MIKPYHQVDSKPDNGMIAMVIRDKRAAAERLRKRHPHIAQRMEEEAAALEHKLTEAMKGRVPNASPTNEAPTTKMADGTSQGDI